MYSIGFYEVLTLLSTSLRCKSQSARCQLLSSVWTVYSILLEYCCKTDYSLLITKISSNYETQKETLISTISQNHTLYLEREQCLKEQFKDIQTDHAELLEEKKYYKKYTDKLNDVIDDLRAKIEEETKVRKAFENKLNDLHSIVRDRDAGYTRAKDDIDKLIHDNFDKGREVMRLTEELKSALESKSAFELQFTTTRNLLMKAKREHEADKKEFQTENARLSKAFQSLSDHSTAADLKLAEMTQKYEDKKTANEGMLKTLAGLKIENTRLTKLVERIKSDDVLENKVASLNKECQELTRDLVGAKEREHGFKTR